ncbi:DAN domain family member 5-like [Hydractinia symbiolongicarpus]|uniref:DAN domain family member 5-like n=1 Tax=Hydractinia symbiolongicarpus TaxID=13093 RepID=UPI00254B5E29|nr:DAN domain family member 5-like [Hydractinia symbiolongicarpus]
MIYYQKMHTKIIFGMVILVLACCKTLHASPSKSLLQRIKNVINKVSGRTIALNKAESQVTLCVPRWYNRTISYKGCSPKTMELKYCYGRCNSLYYPGNKGYQDTLTFCKNCMPNSSHWATIRLDCPFDTNEKHNHFKVEIIDSCKCGLCR